jgi:hypothetical protein
VDATELGKHIPSFEPVFVNLPELPREKLSTAGAFGQVLRVVQQWDERRKVFEQVLGEALGRLEPLAKQERPRWLDLLMYFEALVYNRRTEGEREGLVELIRSSAKSNEDRLELDMAWKTMAQADRERWSKEVTLENKKETLLRLVRLRFGKLPAETEQVIEATKDIERLDEWFDRAVTAKTLAQVGLTAAT